MANRIPVPTLSEIEVLALNKTIWEQILTAPDSLINQMHTFYPAIKADEQVVTISPDFGLIGLKGKIGCSPSSSTNQLTVNEKHWTPKFWGDRLEQCYDTLVTTMAMFALKEKTAVADLTGTQYMAMIEEALTVTFNKALIRMVWFNALNAANVDDSPAGFITSGVNTNYFSNINGLFYQLYAICASDPNRMTSLATYNGQATRALQFSTFTPAVALAAINDTYDNAPVALRSATDKIMIVTDSVMTKARRALQGLGIESTYENQVNGLQTLKLNGLEIVCCAVWDEIIAAYENDGIKLHDPHRIVFTTKSNLAVGLGSQDYFPMFDSFYDKVTRTNYIEFEDQIDAKVIQDNLIQFAY